MTPQDLTATVGNQGVYYHCTIFYHRKKYPCLSHYVVVINTSLGPNGYLSTWLPFKIVQGNYKEIVYSDIFWVTTANILWVCSFLPSF
jgi:hypothetical protein